MNNYNKFDEIQHLPLRVFNRVVFLFNLKQDFGTEAARSYAESFTDGERKQMAIMQQYISSVGEEKARKDVTKGLALVSEQELNLV